MKKVFLMFTLFAGTSCYAQSNDNGWRSSDNGGGTTNSQQSDNSNTASDNGACINVPVTLTGNTQEVTVGNQLPVMTNEKTYVYYHKRGHRRVRRSDEFASMPDPRASQPLLISCKKDAQGMPSQAYTVTLNTSNDHAMACPGATLNLQADISVQQDNEYTGNYPTSAGDKNDYKLVSKRTFRRTERKMRNADRKEKRVARLTGGPVSSSTSTSM